MSAALNLPLLDWKPPTSKEAALGQHERLHPSKLETARSIARELGADGRTLTVRDVRAEMVRRGLLDPTAEASESWLGAVMRGSEWECVGWATYSDASRNCHAKPLRQWRRKDATK